MAFSRRRALALAASVIITSGLVAGVPVSAATSLPLLFDYPDFSSVAGLQLNGTAEQSGNLLSLTRPTDYQAGSAFDLTKVDLTRDFATSFEFNLSNGSSPPADGLTFAIQNAPQGTSALGSVGGGLGVMGLASAAWVEFDTYYNSGIDINANHIAVLSSNDNVENNSNAVDPGFPLHGDGPVYAWVSYDAASSSISVWASPSSTRPASPLLVAPLDLAQVVGASGFVGFTAAVGASNSQQDVLGGWTFDGYPAPTASNVVFVHGINGNFRDIRAAELNGDPSNWGPLVQPLHLEAHLTIFPYYQDVGYSPTGSVNQNCDPLMPGPVTDPNSNLYLDPNSPPLLGVESQSYCDSQSALALNAQALDQLVRSSQANVVVADSMGGAIARGWLAYAQHKDPADTSPEMAGLKDVVFLQGAQQGSWIASGASGLADCASVPVLGGLCQGLGGTVIKLAGFDPLRPGVVDLAPRSNWYQSVNPDAFPLDVNYYNVITDEQVQLQNCVLFWCGNLGAPKNLGDTVLLPGNDSPSAMPSSGGSRFLPGPVAGYQRYEYEIGHLYTFNLADAVVQLPKTISILTGDPASHFNFGSNVNSLNVQSCNSSQQETVTSLVLQVAQGQC